MTDFYLFNFRCFREHSCKTNDLNTFNSRDDGGNNNVSTIDYKTLCFVDLKLNSQFLIIVYYSIKGSKCVQL